MTDTEQHADVAVTGPVPSGRELHPVLADAFAALDRAGVPWALVRGADDLTRPSGDVDVLVDAAALPSLDTILASAGLCRLGVRGHGSHRFYFRYDPTSDLWVKLDVVSAVEFGPFQQLHAPLATGCLRRRRRDGRLWRLDAADEAWLYLLHLLLDKGHIAPGRRAAARAAAEQAFPGAAAALLLDERTGAGSAREVLDAVRAGGSDVSGLALDLRRRWRRRHRWTTGANYLRTRAMRRLAVAAPGHPSGRVVAVLGPDGAGKTTLTEAVRRTFPTPSRSVYMGLWQASRWDRRLRHVPAAALALRVGRVLSGSARAHYHRARRRLVLLDRAPHDALLAGGPTPGLGGRVITALALRLGPRPDLALILDAPGEVMFARKGEHSVEVLERRRRAYLELAPRFARSVVLDATRSAAEVRRAALAAVWADLTSSQPADTGMDGGIAP